MTNRVFKHFLFILFFVCLPALAVGQDTIRILSIGNSFSEDAAEHQLSGLAQAAGLKVIIGNLYIAGCSLERHWEIALDGRGAYSYRKINTEGEKTTTDKVALSAAISDENWDFITFQQASPYSGQYETFFPYLPNLFRFVKERATNPNVKYALHMTWAYAKTSDHKGFANYNNDQLNMYTSIVDANKRAMDAVDGIDILIPSGTAIQNGRTSFIGDNYCRDGYHLQLTYGRYTAACVWLETLLGTSPIGNTYVPEGVAPEYIAVAQKAAHDAVANPFAISSQDKDAKKESKKVTKKVTKKKKVAVAN